MIFTIQIPDPVIILGNHPLQKTSWGNLCQHEHPNSPNNTFNPQNPQKSAKCPFELPELFKKSSSPPSLFLWEKKTNSRKTQGFVWVQPCGCFQKYEKTPQIIHFNRVFHYKPSILGVFPRIYGSTSIWFLVVCPLPQVCRTQAALDIVAMESEVHQEL